MQFQLPSANFSNDFVQGTTTAEPQDVATPGNVQAKVLADADFKSHGRGAHKVPGDVQPV